MATSGFRIEDATKSTPENGRTFNGDAAQTLGRNLQTLAARRNARQLQNALVRSLAVGVSLCAFLMLAHRFYLADVSPWAIATILLASVLIGVRNGTLRRAGVFDAALDADHALGLDDRLSSAMAFVQPQSVRSAERESGSDFLSRLRAWVFPRDAYRTSRATSPTELVPALVLDAAARSAQAEPKQIYPAKFGRAGKILAAASVAFIAFAFMPNIDLLRTPEQKTLAGVLNRQGKKLEEIAKQVRDKKAEEANPETKKLAGRLKALALKMQRGRMSKREALVSMGQLKKDMEQSAQNESSAGGLENIEQLQQNLAEQGMQSEDGQKVQEAAKNRDANKAADALDKLADKMEKGNLSADEKEKAANDMEKAARALRQAGGAKNEEAAKQLEDAAKQLREKNPQGGQKQGGQHGQQGGQQGQQNQSGQKQGAQDQKQNGQNGQQQGQQGQKQGQQGQQGQKRQGQQGGQQQQQQGGQQQQSQNGQSGQNHQGQSGQQQQSQQGGQSSQQGQQGGGQSGQSSSNALRNLAKGLRQGGAQSGNSQSMQKMLDKLREAENDTGQNSGSQSGEGKSGEGGQGSQGHKDGRQSMTPGKDAMPSDPTGQVSGGAGLGPRSKAGGVQKGGGVSNMKSTPSGDKRRWEDVWSDRLPETQKKASRITGKMGNSGNMEQLPTRTEAKGGPVKTPYYEVYESYKKDAEDAVGKDTVPPAYKQPVRDYFDSLKPQGR